MSSPYMFQTFVSSHQRPRLRLRGAHPFKALKPPSTTRGAGNSALSEARQRRGSNLLGAAKAVSGVAALKLTQAFRRRR